MDDDDTSENRGRRHRGTAGLPRAVSVSVKKSRPNILDVRDSEATIEQFDRPRTRGDCEPGGPHAMRPCPFVSCKHHLYLDVSIDTGTLKLNFPDLQPWELQKSCALDIADESGHTLEEVGAIMRLTRERARQIEVKALVKMKLLDPAATGSHDYNHPDPEKVRREFAAKASRKRRVPYRRRLVG